MIYVRPRVWLIQNYDEEAEMWIPVMRYQRWRSLKWKKVLWYVLREMGARVEKGGKFSTDEFGINLAIIKCLDMMTTYVTGNSESEICSKLLSFRKMAKITEVINLALTMDIQLERAVEIIAGQESLETCKGGIKSEKDRG